MKKGGLFLLAILFLTYGYQGYKTVRTYMNDEVTVKTSGRLSDIANNVIPVPLETPDSGVLRQVKRVQRDGNDIFLLSDRRLLHFDISGKFISQPAIEISDNEDVFIAEYTLDTDHNLIIVIDSQRNISKYDYSGNLISKSKINQPWRRITALAYHNGHLWVTAETTEKAADDFYQTIHRLYRLDSDMNEISNQRLYSADVGRDIKFNSLCIDELLVDEDGLYAYSSPSDMKHLLSDTLHILQCKNIPLTAYKNAHNVETGVYPVRKSKRYIMSTNNNSIDNPYTFCYDKTNNDAYMLSEGFKDDFYNTGYVANLQPMDIYNTSYCYIKTESDFSEKTYGKIPGNISEKKNEKDGFKDNPILFIVSLKS